MLVLTRKEGEAVVIDTGRERIVVVVTRVRRDDRQVRLGIDAPHHVKILREELEDPGAAGEGSSRDP